MRTLTLWVLSRGGSFSNDSTSVVNTSLGTSQMFMFTFNRKTVRHLSVIFSCAVDTYSYSQFEYREKYTQRLKNYSQFLKSCCISETTEIQHAYQKAAASFSLRYDVQVKENKRSY